jgi:hypothetical protein
MCVLSTKTERGETTCGGAAESEATEGRESGCEEEASVKWHAKTGSVGWG